MAALTLIEAAKLALNGGQVKRAAVIMLYARASAWLRGIPFRTIGGNSYAYSQEGTLPGIAFRGINEGYVSSAGVINNLSEALRIAGGDLDVDTFILRTQGEGVRSTHEAMKTKALSHSLTAKLIYGDSSTDPREFDGLMRRVNTAGPQFISAGTTDAGDPLSLAKLDELLDLVSGPNKQLWLNRALARRLSQASRNTEIGGFITWDKDEFGGRIASYGGVPLVVPYPDNDGDDVLSFTEQGDVAGTPGGSTSASIYAVSVGDGYLSGIQSGPMQVRDLNEMQELPQVRTRVEWDVGLVVEHPKAIARLGGISNAPIVV